ncbi:MAG: hypothetical protein EPO38_12825, partial [Rhizorhabdus sp.]
PAVHQRVCDEVTCWIEAQGWRCAGITRSPITGPEGNVEFLIGAFRERDGMGDMEPKERPDSLDIL